jgi:transcriptional regulator with XRE-family HTH domain
MPTRLGEKIKALRKERGMTLDALSLAADMSKSYLWELENRDSPRPSAEKLAALAIALSMDVSYFLEADVQEPQERHIDNAFFRNYTELDSDAKEQMRKILDTFRSNRGNK